MSQVQGIGGVFLYAKDAKLLGQWYEKHLGLRLNSYGSGFFMELPSQDIKDKGRRASTTFAIFQHENPERLADKTARINWRIDDLDALLEALRAADVFIEEKEENGEYGRFVYAHDPEGNRLELWQPPLNEKGWPEGETG